MAEQADTDLLLGISRQTLLWALQARVHALRLVWAESHLQQLHRYIDQQEHEMTALVDQVKAVTMLLQLPES